MTNRAYAPFVIVVIVYLLDEAPKRQEVVEKYRENGTRASFPPNRNDPEFAPIGLIVSFQCACAFSPDCSHLVDRKN